VTVHDDAGNVRAEIGNFTLTDGYGIAAYGPNNQPIFVVTDEGQRYPWQLVPLAEPATTLGIGMATWTTYQERGRVDFICTHRYWSFAVTALHTSAPTHTGSFRFRGGIDGAAPSVTLHEETGIGGTTDFTETVDLVSLLGSDVIGKQVTISVELRSTTAGTPPDFYFRSTPYLSGEDAA
jgi:hypothetical protein